MIRTRMAAASWFLVGSLAVCGAAATGCDGENGRDTTPESALALPLVVVDPAENPSSPAKVDLGRMLFWDPVLSGDRNVACATCHHPGFAYADGRALSVGVGGTGVGPARRPSATAHVTKRSSMTILDTAFSGTTRQGSGDPTKAPMFWDSRVASLEQQARGPILALDEMRGTSFDESKIFPEVVSRLQQIPEYVARFALSFGKDSVNETSIVRAIAAFERTLVSHQSSYDRYESGETGALSASALRGLGAFDRSGCTNCHSGPMFSDYEIHQIGAPDLPGLARDLGSGAGGFRTPSLRNVTRTAPYMHSGAFASLDQVFGFYNRVNRRLDPKLDGVRGPDRGDATDVKAFLSALSDGTFDQTIPTEVPSGLTPGGAVR